MDDEFTKLLADLETMQKASGCDEDGKADDKKVVAAAKGAAGDGDGDGDGDGKDGEKKADDKDETFGKAFKIKLEDGSEAEAFDGTELLKALHTQIEEQAAQIIDLKKAFGMIAGLMKSERDRVSEQGELLKALGSKVSTASSAGTGRRTMVSIAEKVVGPVNEKPKATPHEVLAKAQFMAREGKLPWEQAVRVEAHQGRGSIAPPDLLARYPELLIPVGA